MTYNIMNTFNNQPELFWWIMQNRPWYSEIDGAPLHEYLDGGSQQSWCFMHLIAKGGYQRFKLYHKNVILVTPLQHQEYDHVTHEAANDPLFKWVFESADVLRREYHQSDKYYRPNYIPNLRKL